MDDAQLLRYSRHILLPQLGIEGQEKFRRAHALIVGAGGLGSPVALYLAAAGVGLALVPDNIVLPAVDCVVLRLEPRLIREIGVYARTDWSPTAAAFVDVLRSDARRRPSGAVAIQI